MSISCSGMETALSKLEEAVINVPTSCFLVAHRILLGIEMTPNLFIVQYFKNVDGHCLRCKMTRLGCKYRPLLMDSNWIKVFLFERPLTD